MALKLFKEYDFKRLFSKLKEKYKKYGKVTGKIKIKNLKKSEIEAFEEIGKYYRVGEDIVYSVKDLRTFLEGSIYEISSLEELLSSYYNEAIMINSEKKEKEKQERKNYFQSILDHFENTEVYKYFYSIFFEKSSIYKTISLRYNEDKIKLKEEIILVGESLLKLPSFEKKINSLTMFSNEITKDPHYFDESGRHFILLYEGIKYLYDINFESEGVMEKNEVLYKAGLIKEGLLNNIAVYGFTAQREDLKESALLRAANEDGEYVILSIDNINSLKIVESVWDDIYIFENPSVFSYILENIKKTTGKKLALICSSGQLNFAAYKFLEKLSQNGKNIYYSGDIDPEGLLIAINLKKKFNINLIGYNKKIYMENLSGKKISDISLKKLKNINDKELNELVELIKERKEAVYQESFVEILFQNIKSRI